MARPMESEIDKSLSDIYYNPANPAAFGGLQRIYRISKERGLPYSKKQINEWLKKQDTYTSYKPVIYNTERPRVIVSKKYYQFDADTANMVKYKRYNNGFAYILVMIDIFTRYAFTYPLKTVTGKEMLKALNYVFTKFGVKPERIRTDKGSEFIAKIVEDFLETNNIKHFTTTSEKKANFSERLIKTLKTAITRHMFHYQNHRWIDILDQITEAYNSRYHRSIQMSPKEALKADNARLWYNQYLSKKKFLRHKTHSEQKFKFEIDDRVRLAKFKMVFRRAYDQNWTPEIFIISSREFVQGIPMYTVKTLLNKPIIGKFYENQLQKVLVGSKKLFRIEKIIKKESRGKHKGYIVKWYDFGPEHNSWVNAKDMTNISKNFVLDTP